MILERSLVKLTYQVPICVKYYLRFSRQNSYLILRVLDKRILDSSVGSALSAELRVRILPDKLELSQLKAILKIAFLLYLFKLSYYSF